MPSVAPRGACRTLLRRVAFAWGVLSCQNPQHTPGATHTGNPLGTDHLMALATARILRAPLRWCDVYGYMIGWRRCWGQEVHAPSRV
ncbi:hypothetical protein B0T18DRAFT_409758 [Schizothecium vesticola]|uniref:Uncharacterized protein n=1 Tax=Schizothecium vesticola TaxID=314040 RepID=A0AA40EUD5_9PEZI|nr:hypothetical protein B0T18DRAFT_409758 [Schizothecium vesticola]